MIEGNEADRDDREREGHGTPESGDQAAGGKPGDEPSGGTGGEGHQGSGTDKESVTERIGEDGEKGQTAIPAPDDDVGEGSGDES
jgi:hypothetical protein